MQYELKGGNFPVVVCQLASGEQMITEKGSMVWNFTPYTSSLFIMCDFRLSDTKSRTFLSILSSSCCVLC